MVVSSKARFDNIQPVSVRSHDKVIVLFNFSIRSNNCRLAASSIEIEATKNQKNMCRRKSCVLHTIVRPCHLTVAFPSFGSMPTTMAGPLQPTRSLFAGALQMSTKSSGSSFKLSKRDLVLDSSAIFTWSWAVPSTICCTAISRSRLVCCNHWLRSPKDDPS